MTKAHWIGAAVLAVVVAGAAGAQSSSPTTHDHTASTQKHDPAPAEKSGMMGHDRQEKMRADMKAADDRLQDLVARMNAATGNDKVAAIAELLTQLVTDQTAMHRKMATMHDQMTSHK